MVRLAHEMVRLKYLLYCVVALGTRTDHNYCICRKKKSDDPSKVTRSKVWVAGHTHSDGRPVRPEFAETIVSEMGSQKISIDNEVFFCISLHYVGMW